MDSLLNSKRPPAFCPGCTHDRVVRALDRTFQDMNLAGEQIVIVTDIGCSGLFDVFFHTHAFHGLHGRALTYATGLKLASPELHVVVVMGDGGLGIGGAHLIGACRRNLDLTLLVLNNFNFGMTGGQCSSTTPMGAVTGSGFLNTLDAPLDVCSLVEAAGAPFVYRCSGLSGELSKILMQAIAYGGFSVVDIWEICPGRYTKKNKLSPADIGENLARMPSYTGELPHNSRKEYGEHYRELSAGQRPVEPLAQIKPEHTPPCSVKSEILILGSAGQRIGTAGELLCLAALSGGLLATQKNDHDITVLRGASISEVVFWPEEVVFTGIGKPAVILALAQEGVNRRQHLFAALEPDSFVLAVKGVNVPPCSAQCQWVDFGKRGWKKQDWALVALANLAGSKRVISLAMLTSALEHRFTGKVLRAAKKILANVGDQGEDIGKGG